LQIFSDLSAKFLAIANIMRLLVEVVLIAAVFSLGWGKPFKERFAEVNRIITSTLHDVGAKLQKHQDHSVKRH